MKFKQLFTAVALTLATCAALAADGQISLKAEAFVERQVRAEDGSVETVRESATEVFPGSEVIYVVSFTNVGNKLVDELVINNPVPEMMRYKAGSAFGRSNVPQVSVNGGAHYGRLTQLSVVGNDGKPRPATEGDVTDVRWSINYSLKASETGTVGFRAILK